MSVATAASYVVGQCTYYVAETLSWVPAGLGNAYQWLSNAQSRGYAISNSPAVGDIAVWGSSLPGSEGFGHVAVVTALGPNNTFQVSEMNYSGGPGVVDSRWVTNNSNLEGFIEPPGGSTSSSGTGDTASTTSLNLGPFTLQSPFPAGVNSVDQWVEGLFGVSSISDLLERSWLIVGGIIVALIGLIVIAHHYTEGSEVSMPTSRVSMSRHGSNVS